MSKLLISLLLLSNEFFNLRKYYVESISVRIINSPATCASEFQKFDTQFYKPLNTLNYRGHHSTNTGKAFTIFHKVINHKGGTEELRAFKAAFRAANKGTIDHIHGSTLGPQRACLD